MYMIHKQLPLSLSVTSSHQSARDYYYHYELLQLYVFLFNVIIVITEILVLDFFLPMKQLQKEINDILLFMELAPNKYSPHYIIPVSTCILP